MFHITHTKYCLSSIFQMFLKNKKKEISYPKSEKIKIEDLTVLCMFHITHTKILFIFDFFQLFLSLWKRIIFERKKFGHFLKSENRKLEDLI